MEEHDAGNHCAHGTNASPYGIGSSYRDGLYGFGQQNHAQCEHNQETGTPQPPDCAFQSFHLSKAEREASLAKSCNNQYNPVHYI